MKLSKILLFSLLVLLMSPGFVVNAQENDKVVSIGGEKFIQHRVKSGETLFSIGKKYRVESKELVNINPSLLQGLKVGEVLTIPYREDIIYQEEAIQVQQPDSFIIHKIQRRETPFFVAQKYHIKVEDIYKYNPSLKRFRRGKEIRIPQFSEVLAPTPSINPEEVIKQKSPDISGDGTIEHLVRPGETLFSLSKKYERPISEILFYNPDVPPLKIGMVIRLPEKGREVETGNRIRKEGQYFIHMIETGETLYGLSKKYHITEQELIDLNPVLENGFPAGVELRIPLENLPEARVAPVNEDAFDIHVVRKGETLYRLSALYDVKISEIKKANPSLQSRDGLVEGEAVLIPKKPELKIELLSDEETSGEDERGEEFVEAHAPDDSFYEVETIVEVPESCRPGQNSAYLYETYHVALMLPLFVEANDTLNNKPVAIDSMAVDSVFDMVIDADTIETEFSPEDQTWKFYRNTENFLHFYEGVLLAVDSMEKRGMNIELHVYDTKRDPRTIDSLLNTYEFLDMDLIIGPVYPFLQYNVAAFAAKNRIPFVSPLSSDGRLVQNDPYYYQVYPSQEFMLKKTAEYIADEYYNSNFIVLEIGSQSVNDSLFVEMCREKLYNSGYYRDVDNVSFRIYDFNRYGGQGISRILSKTKENVFIIPSFNEGEVSVAVSNINNNAADYNITVIGNYRYKQFESIDQEHFHNVKLKYFYPYWTDYSSPVVTKFVSDFRKYFNTDPNPYSMQGYDVAFYFLDAFMNYGKDFDGCLPYMQPGLTQGDYRFEKVSRFGGYMNHGVSLISYNRDYTVVKKEVSGKIKFVFIEDKKLPSLFRRRE